MWRLTERPVTTEDITTLVQVFTEALGNDLVSSIGFGQWRGILYWWIWQHPTPTRWVGTLSDDWLTAAFPPLSSVYTLAVDPVVGWCSVGHGSLTTDPDAILQIRELVTSTVAKGHGVPDALRARSLRWTLPVTMSLGGLLMLSSITTIVALWVSHSHIWGVMSIITALGGLSLTWWLYSLHRRLATAISPMETSANTGS